MTTKRNMAVLAGNGLSIAFNPDLNLQRITEEVLRRIERAEGGDVVAAMREIAERALPDGASSAEDFEVLVGSFGAESRTLDLLDTLAELTSPADKDLRRSIQRVVKFGEGPRHRSIPRPPGNLRAVARIRRSSTEPERPGCKHHEVLRRKDYHWQSELRHTATCRTSDHMPVRPGRHGARLSQCYSDD